MEERTNAKGHRLSITERSACSIYGVGEILSFDPKEIHMSTELGTLTMKGNELRVKRLSVEKGEAEIIGHIDSLQYADTYSAKEMASGLLGRMFK